MLTKSRLFSFCQLSVCIHWDWDNLHHPWLHQHQPSIVDSSFHRLLHRILLHMAQLLLDPEIIIWHSLLLKQSLIKSTSYYFSLFDFWVLYKTIPWIAIFRQELEHNEFLWMNSNNSLDRCLLVYPLHFLFGSSKRYLRLMPMMPTGIYWEITSYLWK